VTLNGVIALILCYFTEFVYNVVLKQLLGLPRFQNLPLVVYDHINTICAILQRVLEQNKRRQQPLVQSVVAYVHVS